MLTSCAPVSAVVADNVPTFLGGMPKGVPPRRGTPEYDEWMKKRAEDAAAIKPAKGSGTGQQAEVSRLLMGHVACPPSLVSGRHGRIIVIPVGWRQMRGSA